MARLALRLAQEVADIPAAVGAMDAGIGQFLTNRVDGAPGQRHDCSVKRKSFHDVDETLGEWWGSLPGWGIILVYFAIMFVIIAVAAFIAGLIR